ncbi:uncharacterized protein [Spinacia oleracea]|uniref:Uncharacterized protein n=1 Tax=Spinacia oleracea TaxID=3562 RepID=A0ABM3R0Y6_SPIOL|nr:uncharacterized protein LOC130463993 [Spinacia oleracea]
MPQKTKGVTSVGGRRGLRNSPTNNEQSECGSLSSSIGATSLISYNIFKTFHMYASTPGMRHYMLWLPQEASQAYSRHYHHLQHLLQILPSVLRRLESDMDVLNVVFLSRVLVATLRLTNIWCFICPQARIIIF